MVVELYAAGTEVELLQDGVSLGRQPCGAATGYMAHFETTYRPGTLEAVAYDGAVELGRMCLSSAGEVTALSLEAEEDVGQLRYVHLTLRDAAGSIVADADREVTVTVSGGTLLGLGSGDPKPKHNYIDAVTDTFHGRALAIVRCGEGEVTVTAESDGLKTSLTL